MRKKNRRKNSIDALFPKTRKGILSATMMHEEKWWYLSDLAAHLKTTPSALQRELAHLTDSGILRRRVSGRRVYYQPEPTCPIRAELKSMMLKTAGMADLLRHALHPFADRIRWAFIYGSVARGHEYAGSDVDLMIIGDVTLRDLSRALRKLEACLEREVNPTIYAPADFIAKRRAGHHFINAVLRRRTITIMGGRNELEKT
jgi:predicted nucleotidyltransferase/DNA-binding HxlR family transcriptional regulator